MVTKSIELLKKNKVPVSILCTISRDNINDIEEIVKLTDKLDAAVCFCTPVTIKNTTFRLGNNGDSIDLNKDELKDVLFRIIRLKKQGYNIINSLEYLMDSVRYLGKKNIYKCLGGNKIFYVDWNLNVYPCMCKGKPVKIDRYDFDKAGNECNDCMIQCFREPSILLFKRVETTKIFMKEFPFLLLLGMKRAKTLLR
jgi:MoaA/NifB/PqqE/SkfB family radical SAM enzyme